MTKGTTLASKPLCAADVTLVGNVLTLMSVPFPAWKDSGPKQDRLHALQPHRESQLDRTVKLSVKQACTAQMDSNSRLRNASQATSALTAMLGGEPHAAQVTTPVAGSPAAPGVLWGINARREER